MDKLGPFLGRQAGELIVRTRRGVRNTFNTMRAKGSAMLPKRRGPSRSGVASPGQPPQLSPLTMIVVSDTHLGEGPVGDVRRPPSPREDFTVDAEFHQFVTHLVHRQKGERPDEKLRLVLAGDVFEFLNGVSAGPDGQPLAKNPTQREHPTAELAQSAMRTILKGHPGFIDALGQLLRAGHDVVFAPGNHDQELFFRQVRRELRQALLAVAPAARGQIKFTPWGHHDGRIWVEHGQRYDQLNSLQAHLTPATNGTLRAAAGNLMSTRVYEVIADKVPGIKFIPTGWPQIKATVKRAPLAALRAIWGFAKELAKERTPLPDAERTKLKRRQAAGLRAIALEVRDQMNAARQNDGQPLVTFGEALDIVRAFDRAGAAPYANLPSWRGRFLLTRALNFFTPKELGLWINTNSHTTISDGLRVAFDQLGAQVVVMGHRHGAEHLITCRNGKDCHVVDAGTWTPIDRADPTAMLTFTEIRRDNKGQHEVHLRRWAPRTASIVDIPPTRVADGAIPTLKGF